MASGSMQRIRTPLTQELVMSLEAGHWVRLSGEAFLARDATLDRLQAAYEQGGSLPARLTGSVIYYAGPTPAVPGRPIGSIGPTTARRMDRTLPFLFSQGVQATIGKGQRSRQAYELHQSHRTLYFLACGGAAAYLSRAVTACEVIAYQELGPQAFQRVMLEDLPLLVAYDAQGGNIFQYRTEEREIDRKTAPLRQDS